MSNRGGVRAVVLGGTLAGLFTARVLADSYDQVTVIDRVLADFRALGCRRRVEHPCFPGHRSGRSDRPEAERRGERRALPGPRGPVGQLKATEALGVLAEISGDYSEAARLHTDGLQIAEDLGLWTETSHKLAMLGRIALLAEDYDTAASLHERSMRLAGEQSNKLGEDFAEIGLALGARRQGKLDVAEAHLRKRLDWLRQLNSDNGVALVLAELGFIAELRGDVESARGLHQDGLVAARATGDPRAVALALEGLAGVQALAGRHDQAARLLGAATAARKSTGAPLPAEERGTWTGSPPLCARRWGTPLSPPSGSAGAISRPTTTRGAPLCRRDPLSGQGPFLDS
jgi:tetratricopeptide (TPR) repeat protein